MRAGSDVSISTALLDLLIGHAHACFDLLIGKRVRLVAELRVDRYFERVRLLNYCVAFEIIICFYEGDFEACDQAVRE